MSFQPSPRERFENLNERKPNRIRTVNKLPAQGEHGETVYVDGELYFWDNNKWHDVAQNARDAFQSELLALAERVKTLEDD